MAINQPNSGDMESQGADQLSSQERKAAQEQFHTDTQLFEYAKRAEALGDPGKAGLKVADVQAEVRNSLEQRPLTLEDALGPLQPTQATKIEAAAAKTPGLTNDPKGQELYEELFGDMDRDDQNKNTRQGGSETRQ